MDQYVHTKLEHPSSQIRLLEIVSPEHFLLDTWELHDTPAYLAISYAWGSPKPSRIISVNFENFAVTHNASEALSQAIRAASRRGISYVWLDSICIQQSSPYEKGHQVGIMDSIYSKALVVCACVGQHVGRSKQLFDHANGKDDMHAIDRIEAVEAFMQRPYWSRLWIVQELVLATSPTSILCGTDEVSTSSLRMLCIACFRANASIPEAALRILAYAETGGAVSSAHQNAPREDNKSATNLFELLKNFGRLHCRDPRDRIFGLLGLLRGSNNLDHIAPDYSSTRLHLACEVIKRYDSSRYSGAGFVSVDGLADLLIALHKSISCTLRRQNIDLLYWRHKPGHGILTLSDDIQESRLLEGGNYTKYDDGNLFAVEFHIFDLAVNPNRGKTFDLRSAAAIAGRLSFYNAHVTSQDSPLETSLVLSQRTVAYAATGVVAGDLLLIPRSGNYSSWGNSAIIARLDSDKGCYRYVSTPRLVETQDTVLADWQDWVVDQRGYSVRCPVLNLNLTDVLALISVLFFEVYWSTGVKSNKDAPSAYHDPSPLTSPGNLEPGAPLLRVLDSGRSVIRTIEQDEYFSQSEVDLAYELLQTEVASNFD